MALRNTDLHQSSGFTRKNLSFLILFFVFLLVGIFVFRDYGLSWDEPISRIDNGLVNYNYIVHGDYDALINGNEKYHGPVFEIFLIAVEKALQLTDSRDIHLMRHLLTFLCFALSVFFFYLICRRYFKSQILGIAGCLFLIASPRIFADAFYNSKDLAFLSFFIINIYTALVFAERKDIRSALIHAFVSAIVIDIRIMGVIIPVFSMMCWLLDLFIKKEYRNSRSYFTFSVFIAALLCFIILFWPVMWRHPLDNFLGALREMSKYHWFDSVLYRGEFIPSTMLPWHYIPAWMVITTPVMYTLLFIIGLVSIVFKSARKHFFYAPVSKFYLLTFYTFFIPLLSVIALQSIMYDGWRHLYFIYPSFLLISVAGVKQLLSWASRRIFIRNIIYLVLFVSIAHTGWTMTKLHPFENVYFNKLAGHPGNLRDRYELDYWGLSYKDAIEYVLQNDTSETIVLKAANFPGPHNLEMISKKDRPRILFTETLSEADYFLSNFRWHPEEYSEGTEYYSLKAGPVAFMKVYKRTNTIGSLIKNRPVLYSTSAGFETGEKFVSAHSVVEAGAGCHSGVKCDYLDSKGEYSDAATLSFPSRKTAENETFMLYVSCWIKSTEKNSTFAMVSEARAANDSTYFWHSNPFLGKTPGTWEKKEFLISLPVPLSASDTIRLYIWNLNRKEIFADDIEIKIFSVQEVPQYLQEFL